MKALIISFVTHVVVIGAVLLGSVVAPETMPRLLKRISPPILASIVPPHDLPLPPRQPKSTAVKPSSTMTAATAADFPTSAPRVAPNGITPETGNERGGLPGGGVVGVVDGAAGVSEFGSIAAPVPPPPPANKPVRLHSGMTAPRKVVDVPPNYPEIALRTRKDGIVIVEATIDERGNVIAAHVLRPAPLLDEAALAAVRQWKFTPAMLNGEPVPVVMTVTVNFQLR
ncbi:MAG TPA: energy transducer TonB [Vicinamibacterales bacterium]|jgi:protein TonB